MFFCMIDEEKFPVWAYGAIGGFVLLVVLIAVLIAFCRTRKQHNSGMMQQMKLITRLSCCKSVSMI